MKADRGFGDGKRGTGKNESRKASAEENLLDDDKTLCFGRTFFSFIFPISQYEDLC